MSDKPKFPAKVARAVGEKIVEVLKPVCARIAIAGSLRREKELVGDVEILFIPKFMDVRNPLSLFGDETIRVSAADVVIQELIEHGSLAKRPKSDGETFTWGEWIKLAVAVKTGVPVDLFATNEANWFNTLVCRTGSKEMNTRICTAAMQRGFHWRPSPNHGGFVRESDRQIFYHFHTERAVFEFVGLDYLEPWQR